ncbi:MAG: hypothetical protein JWM88_3446 [Verrucomicrobia bacterium]|nr:hypothetical protein [Verrucomicrobiota bacterium]
MNRPLPSTAASSHPLRTDQWRQISLITAVAAGIFALFRWLPTGTNLSHMDFRVTAKNPIDFCDPLNPQFIPVVAVASPVTMTLRTGQPAAAGREAHCVLSLRTASGKPVAPQDLLVAHTRLLHLLIADPSLTDYQHVHPEPGRVPGEWIFSFTPRRGGDYRVFADFTPAATARSLYANADLKVLGPGEAGPSASFFTKSWVVEQDGFHFALVPAALPVRAGQAVDLKFAIENLRRGAAVPMQPVMGAFAHLVAFDSARSGFAHLHPMETDLAQIPDAVRPVLNFKIMFPRAGTYVIWAQVNLGGKETFVPFWFDVAG